MRDIKALAKKYFEENAVRYTEDFYFLLKDHPKWIRHKSILELVEEFVPEKGSKVLDIGCGPGLLAIDLGRKGMLELVWTYQTKCFLLQKNKSLNQILEVGTFFWGMQKERI